MAYSHVLNDHEKRELLRISRATLREFLRTGRPPPGKPHRDSLLENAGAFVTLHKAGALRGCIGSLAEAKPLYKTIQEMTIAAASREWVIDLCDRLQRYKPSHSTSLPRVSRKAS